MLSGRLESCTQAYQRMLGQILTARLSEEARDPLEMQFVLLQSQLPPRYPGSARSCLHQATIFSYSSGSRLVRQLMP